RAVAKVLVSAALCRAIEPRPGNIRHTRRVFHSAPSTRRGRGVHPVRDWIDQLSFRARWTATAPGAKPAPLASAYLAIMTFSLRLGWYKAGKSVSCGLVKLSGPENPSQDNARRFV